MRISDWSSDVCSSDLHSRINREPDHALDGVIAGDAGGDGKQKRNGQPDDWRADDREEKLTDDQNRDTCRKAAKNGGEIAKVGIAHPERGAATTGNRTRKNGQTERPHDSGRESGGDRGW